MLQNVEVNRMHAVFEWIKPRRLQQVRLELQPCELWEAGHSITHFLNGSITVPIFETRMFLQYRVCLWSNAQDCQSWFEVKKGMCSALTDVYSVKMEESPHLFCIFIVGGQEDIAFTENGGIFAATDGVHFPLSVEVVHHMKVPKPASAKWKSSDIMSIPRWHCREQRSLRIPLN